MAGIRSANPAAVATFLMPFQAAPTIVRFGVGLATCILSVSISAASNLVG